MWELCEDSFFENSYEYDKEDGVRVDPSSFGGASTQDQLWEYPSKHNKVFLIDYASKYYFPTLRGGGYACDPGDLKVYSRYSLSSGYPPKGYRTDLTMFGVGLRVVRPLFSN